MDVIDTYARQLGAIGAAGLDHLTNRQTRVFIEVLRSDDPRKFRDVANELALSKPVLSRAVSGLEAHGYVSRQFSEDDYRDVFLKPGPRADKLKAAIEQALSCG